MDIGSATAAGASSGLAVKAAQLSNDAIKAEGEGALKLVEGAGKAGGSVDPDKGNHVDVRA